MKWKIEGADRKTGEDRTLELDAPDEPSAIREAGKHLLVAAVNAVNGHGIASPLDYASSRKPEKVIDPRSAAYAAERATLFPYERRALISLNVLAGLFHFIGFCSLIGGWLTSDRRNDRFQMDNAIGASANAIEETLRQSGQMNMVYTGLLMIAAALLAQIVANQIYTRAAIRAGNL